MTTSPPRKRSNIISMVTFIVILLTFGYYYFYYVPMNQARFTEQAFRIIERVSLNVKAKTANYQKIIDNTMKNIQLQKIYNSTAQQDLQSHLQAVGFPEELHLVSVTPYHPAKLMAGQRVEFVNDKLRFTYISQRADKFFVAVFEYDGINFFPNTLRYDFFKDYILFTDEDVVYSDVPLTHQVISDSLKFEGPLQSSRQITIIIDQKPHQLYIVPVSIGGNSLFVGGLTNQHYFDAFTHMLSPYTYAIIALLVILLVVALPFFKLYFITEKERLNTWDAIFSFMALLFGTAFLAVMLIYYLQQIGPEEHLRVKFLENVAQSLENNFKKEIGDILHQIQEDEEQLAESSSPTNAAPWKYDRYMKPEDSSLFTHYSDYNAITWINSTAGQIAKWNIDNITARVNTSKRKYFTEVRDGHLFADTGFSKKPFYIESIYSQTEGKHYAIISKKSSVKEALDMSPVEMEMKGDSVLYPSVVMVATQLRSLNNQHLPDHISYMVIDTHGNVLFHRNPRKQLQENFLEETNDNHILNECLHAHTSNHFVDTYDTHRRLFHVEPIGQLPLYLVTYLDFEYERLVDVQILGLTSALFIGFFLLIILMVTLFVYVDFESVKKIKSYNLFFKWFWPNRNKRPLYVLLSLFLFLSVSLFILGDFFHSVSMTFSFFMVVSVTVILCLRQFKNWNEIRSRPGYILYFISAYGAGFVGFFNSLYAMKLDSIWGLLFVLFIGACLFFSYPPNYAKRFLPGSKGVLHFNTFVFILVIALGIVPVISFFKRAFDYEKELYLKNIQLNLAEQYTSGSASEGFSDYRSLNFSNESYLRFSVARIDKIPDTSSTDENKTPLSAFMQNFRLGSSSSFFTSHYLNEIDYSSERPFFWDKKHGLLDLYVKANPGLKITSGMIQLNRDYLFKKSLTPWQLFAVFTILFILFLLLVSRLVLYWTRRIFLLGLLPKISNDLGPALKELTHHTLIISASFSEGVNYLKHTYKNKKHLWVDLTNPTPNITADNVVKVIELNRLNYIIFADYKPFDQEIISEKIKWIKTVLAYNVENPSHHVRILIVTPYLPVHMDALEDGDEPYLIRKYLETVSGFKKSYYPLGFENDQRLTKNSSHKNMEKKLAQEVLFLPAYELGKYMTFLNKQRKEAGMDKNDLILYIQSSEQMMYHSIWNNCTVPEQYLIYDLSQDGLLNSKNLPGIYNLLLKGIMVTKNGRLKLFNHSFQNFVLSVISPRQALEIEYEAKMEGGWANSQLPIIMIIFGLLLFLFISQQDIFNQLIGWVTAALGSIPLLTRALVGMGGLKVLNFSSKKQQ